MKILMLPWLAHGHINPFLELAKKLADRSFHIYFCSTAVNLSSINDRIAGTYSKSIQPVELALPSSPELPPHRHTTNGLPSHLMSALKTAFEQAIPAFSSILKTLNPDLVIYDFNQPWAPKAASPLNIPAIVFSTFGAAFLSFTIHTTENPGVEFPFHEIHLHEYEKPGFHNLLQATSNGVKDIDRFFSALNQSSGIVLIKSSTEMEQKYLDYISVLAKKKIQAVGPLVQEPLISSSQGDSDAEIMEWLGKKPELSTVFVSFGSEYFLSREEIEEIANGLELSSVNFIWVVRFPSGEKTRVSEALPEGFLARVGERGKIVQGWAPQARILKHPSVGGFVSHCGWSSVMESIKFGVPIVAMPMHLDQPQNARLVAEIGAGVEVRRDQAGRLRREEIARVLKETVVDDQRQEDGEVAGMIRTTVGELREKIMTREEEEMDDLAELLTHLFAQGK
ncbi:beta-D-glucosyl crocetin beta-1,6-glucosyltransferase-like isoform X17 [Diospyros lotus]|uniref:beta-D-glucosyl crocetin beta-1,6-glucosyltransferase-like isoform X17 n=1 Tax=Diospyros lotus TaxID=55363 RepID=UPI00224DA11A|nr:beta-D-glucosyl crocetin beta-1,6-glucosyltransferase-like isoform X17 [Diospyros lotus]